MNTLHKSLIGGENIEPSKGQRELLCSNKDSHRCPFLGSIINNRDSEDVALDYLAKVLVEAFLDKEEYERSNTNKQ